MNPLASDLAGIRELSLGAAQHRAVVDHGRRKLRGEYHADETPERKAYGLLGGRIEGSRAAATDVFCLARNVRQERPYKQEMDALMASLAVPSETPLDHRGWVADPHEVLAADQRFADAGATLFATYHAHRVAWPDDPLRDTCTAVDEALARGRGLWVVIVSLVDPHRPILRAFFEGDNGREARVLVESD